MEAPPVVVIRPRRKTAPAHASAVRPRRGLAPLWQERGSCSYRRIRPKASCGRERGEREALCGHRRSPCGRGSRDGGRGQGGWAGKCASCQSSKIQICPRRAEQKRPPDRTTTKQMRAVTGAPGRSQGKGMRPDVLRLRRPDSVAAPWMCHSLSANAIR